MIEQLKADGSRFKQALCRHDFPPCIIIEKDAVMKLSIQCPKCKKWKVVAEGDRL